MIFHSVSSKLGRRTTPLPWLTLGGLTHGSRFENWRICNRLKIFMFYDSLILVND